MSQPDVGQRLVGRLGAYKSVSYIYILRLYMGLYRDYKVYIGVI